MSEENKTPTAIDFLKTIRLLVGNIVKNTKEDDTYELADKAFGYLDFLIKQSGDQTYEIVQGDRK